MHNNDGPKQTRRSALKGLALGGGALVVSKWSAPTVESVVLPAHARQSEVMTELQSGAQSQVTQIITLDDGLG